MHKDRLLLLADYLDGSGKFAGRGVNPDKFDLGSWMVESEYYVRARKSAFLMAPEKAERILSTRRIGEPYYVNKEQDFVQPLECQTVGCAVGWAGALPEFNELGLGLMVDGRHTLYPKYVDQDGLEYSGDEAVEKFFDISFMSVDYLFYPCSYTDADRDNPKAVANRIREFVG